MLFALQTAQVPNERGMVSLVDISFVVSSVANPRGSDFPAAAPAPAEGRSCCARGAGAGVVAARHWPLPARRHRNAPLRTMEET